MRSWLWLGSVACVVVAASCASTARRPSRDSEAGAGGEDGGGKSTKGGSPQGGAASEGLAGSPPELGGAGASASDAGGAGEAGAGGAPWTETTDGWLSGARLHAVMKTFSSVKLFEHWHDSLLGVDCAFALDSHGTERCLPLTPGVVTGYRDQKCEQPVLTYLPSLPEIPKYVASPDWVGCNTGRVFHEVGAELSGAVAPYNEVRGECGIAVNGLDEPVVRALGPVVSDDTFVAAARWVREPRGEGLEANVRIAEDGSREVVSHFDAQRGVDCVPQASACMPRDQAYAGFYFADSSCMTGAALRQDLPTLPCRAPAIILDDLGTYFEVGKLLTSPIYRSNQGCTPFSTDTKLLSFYAVGAEVSPDGFPQLTQKPEGEGRAQVTTLRAEGGAVVARQEPLYDTGFGECWIAPTADGALRCLPASGYNGGEFADDECSDALASFVAGETPAAGAFVLTPTVGSVGNAVFELGSKVPTPSAIWWFNGPECVPGVVSQGHDYYATTPLAPAEFLLIQRLVE